MIVTTLGALAQAEPALGRLAAEKLPFQTAYRVAKLAAAVAEETKHFYDQRNGLVKDYGAAKPGGGPDALEVTPAMPTWPAFVAKVEELAAVEVRIDRWPLELGAVEGLTVTAADLLALAPLLAADDEGAANPAPAAGARP